MRSLARMPQSGDTPLGKPEKAGLLRAKSEDPAAKPEAQAAKPAFPEKQYKGEYKYET